MAKRATLSIRDSAENDDDDDDIDDYGPSVRLPTVRKCPQNFHDTQHEPTTQTLYNVHSMHTRENCVHIPLTAR